MEVLRNILGLVSLLALVSVSACKTDDDSDDEGSASLDSGVDPNKAGGDLTRAENEAVCQAGYDWMIDELFSDGYRAMCRAVSVQVALDRDTLRALSG